MNVSKFNSRVFDVDVTDYGYCTLESLFKANGPDAIYRVEAFFIGTQSEINDESAVAAISADGLINFSAVRKVKNEMGQTITVKASEEGCYVNIPQHQLGEVKNILADGEAVQCINEGGFGFTIRKYHQNTYNKDCYAARWCNYETTYSDLDI